MSYRVSFITWDFISDIPRGIYSHEHTSGVPSYGASHVECPMGSYGIFWETTYGMSEPMLRWGGPIVGYFFPVALGRASEAPVHAGIGFRTVQI